MKRKKVVVIGGGTGTYQVLIGLKKYPVGLTAIVSMMDSGGSNRVIRDEFGLLPTSDLRQCMVALASPKSHELLRQLFTYRYTQGTGISGMTFGNLFMAALTDIYSSQEEAIKKTCEMLDVQGQILPVTFSDSHLVARYDDGHQVLGEHYIDEADEKNGGHRIVELELIPKARPNSKALHSIKEADLIVMGPGDLYTSTICNFIVDGITKAIKNSKAKKVYIMNLMSKWGQTDEFSAQDHINELEKYLGEGAINVCLINKKLKMPGSILKRYKEEKAHAIKDDLISRRNFRVIRRGLVSDGFYEKSASDKLVRSLIRHDSKKLAAAIMSII